MKYIYLLLSAIAFGALTVPYSPNVTQIHQNIDNFMLVVTGLMCFGFFMKELISDLLIALKKKYPDYSGNQIVPEGKLAWVKYDDKWHIRVSDGTGKYYLDQAFSGPTNNWDHGRAFDQIPDELRKGL